MGVGFSKSEYGELIKWWHGQIQHDDNAVSWTGWRKSFVGKIGVRSYLGPDDDGSDCNVAVDDESSVDDARNDAA